MAALVLGGDRAPHHLRPGPPAGGLQPAADRLRGVLRAGNEHAGVVADRTLRTVQEAMSMTY
jgi:hypothetical protein